jgi:hypothetical protein
MKTTCVGLIGIPNQYFYFFMLSARKFPDLLSFVTILGAPAIMAWCGMAWHGVALQQK